MCSSALVLLTDSGKTYFEANGGQELPNISLTTSGTTTTVTTANTAGKVLDDDASTLPVANGTAEEGVTLSGATMATFSASDDDETPVVDFTAGTNDNGYYELGTGADAGKVLLTDAGKTYLEANGGQELPNIS